jgi:hypothetical protein
MKWHVIHRWVLLFIAVATFLSGAVQMIAPGFVLNLVRASQTPTSLHFFAIVGMFMVLFGGLLWHALLTQDSRSQAIPVLWASLQKFGASIAVALGIAHAIFSPLSHGWLQVLIFRYIGASMVVSHSSGEIT